MKKDEKNCPWPLQKCTADALNRVETLQDILFFKREIEKLPQYGVE